MSLARPPIRSRTPLPSSARHGACFSATAMAACTFIHPLRERERERFIAHAIEFGAGAPSQSGDTPGWAPSDSPRALRGCCCRHRRRRRRRRRPRLRELRCSPTWVCQVQDELNFPLARDLRPLTSKAETVCVCMRARATCSSESNIQSFPTAIAAAPEDGDRCQL